MIIAWYGTASVSVETENGKSLFDPFLPLPGCRTDTGLRDFRGYRNVVITHAHPDHIGNLPALYEEEKREICGTQAVTGALTDDRSGEKEWDRTVSWQMFFRRIC